MLSFKREGIAVELIQTHTFITLIDSLGTSSSLFFKRHISLYICTTIALVGKVCGRFGAKRAEVTFRLFYWCQVKGMSPILLTIKNQLVLILKPTMRRFKVVAVFLIRLADAVLPL